MHSTKLAGASLLTKMEVAIENHLIGFNISLNSVYLF